MTENNDFVVAGGPADFMTVRHLVLRGDQTAIGRALAQEVRARSNWAPGPVDPVVGRARRTWFERNWPQHHARMTGAAEVFGVGAHDPVSLDGLSGLPAGSGCSAAWCPPAGAVDGRGRLGRNYDFFTLSERELMVVFGGGEPAPSNDPPMASRPYVITTVPDDGLASTVLTMSELDGCMEGINEAGLAVALLLADITATEPPDGSAGPQAGLGVVQVPRFLLDTCENVEQATVALLGAKQYDQGAACHYLVADASGNGFVWERGAHDAEHIIEVSDGPLCVTNHPLHRYPDVADLPPDTAETFLTYERVRSLAKETAGAPTSDRGLRAALDRVAMPFAAREPWRTLWRTVFDVAARTMSTRFYLGDTAGYSDEITFEVLR